MAQEKILDGVRNSQNAARYSVYPCKIHAELAFENGHQKVTIELTSIVNIVHNSENAGPYPIYYIK